MPYVGSWPEFAARMAVPPRMDPFLREWYFRPDQLVAAVADWLVDLAVAHRGRVLSQQARVEEQMTLMRTHGIDPSLVVVFPVIPAHSTRVARLNCSAAEFRDEVAAPLLRAQQIVGEYQQEHGGLVGSYSVNLMTLATQLRILSEPPVHPLACRYAILQLVFADVLPFQLIPDFFAHQFSLYATLGSPAHNPLAVATACTGLVATWVRYYEVLENCDLTEESGRHDTEDAPRCTAGSSRQESRSRGTETDRA